MSRLILGPTQPHMQCALQIKWPWQKADHPLPYRTGDNLWRHIRVLISPEPDQEGNKLGSMSGTCAISTTSRCELSSSFLFFLQGKALKEIHAILTETLACFLPGQAKDLSAHLYLHSITCLHGWQRATLYKNGSQEKKQRRCEAN